MSKILSTLLLAGLVLVGTTLHVEAKGGKAPTKCIVSGEGFGGDMGKPIDVKYKGETIKLCCKGCVKKFNANPEKYYALYQAEMAR